MAYVFWDVSTRPGSMTLTVQESHKADIIDAPAATSGSLALEMMPDAITLYSYHSGTSWEVIGRADPGSPTFNAQIDWLKVEAMVRGAKHKPVAIWLPPDQVLRRSLVIGGRGAHARRSAAAAIFERDNDLKADEIRVAVAPAQPGAAAVSCLAVLNQTCAEAERYANRWGFPAGAVSCRFKCEDFPAIPDFATCDSGPVRVLRRTGLYAGLAAAGSAAAAALVALTVWTGEQITAPETPETTRIAATGAPVLALSEQTDTAPVLTGLGPSPISAMTTPKGVAWPLLVLDTQAQSPRGGHPASAPKVPGSAPGLIASVPASRMTLGGAPSYPLIDTASTLTAPSEAPEPHDNRAIADLNQTRETLAAEIQPVQVASISPDVGGALSDQATDDETLDPRAETQFAPDFAPQPSARPGDFSQADVIAPEAAGPEFGTQVAASSETSIDAADPVSAEIAPAGSNGAAPVPTDEHPAPGLREPARDRDGAGLPDPGPDTAFDGAFAGNGCAQHR